MIINHEPFIRSIKLEDFLTNFNHKFIILNIKEEGIEKDVLNLMKKFNINNFFLLDQSFPFLIKTIFNGEKRTAIRISEYESYETALNLSGLADWVWIDYFTKFPLDKIKYTLIKKAGFRICIVSPELQGFPIQKALSLKQFLGKSEIEIDAVCTKQPSIWC